MLWGQMAWENLPCLKSWQEPRTFLTEKPVLLRAIPWACCSKSHRWMKVKRLKKISSLRLQTCLQRLTALMRLATSWPIPMQTLMPSWQRWASCRMRSMPPMVGIWTASFLRLWMRCSVPTRMKMWLTSPVVSVVVWRCASFCLRHLICCYLTSQLTIWMPNPFYGLSSSSKIIPVPFWR